MARTRYRFAEHHLPHFLTCTVVEWLPVFTRPEAAQVLFDAWTWQQQHATLRRSGFVVLESQLHAVAPASASWAAYEPAQAASWSANPHRCSAEPRRSP